MKRRILFSVMCAVIAASVFAQGQGQGLAGINEATSLMTSYFDPATKLCYAIGAVLGLVGGIKTYGKFSSGDPDTSKTAASWFFACIFLIVAATNPAFLLPLSGMEYSVNKGAGNPVEFKGLKSQYLFVFAGGLVTVLLAVVILYLAGVDQWICIPFGTVSGGLLAWAVFRLNARYGEHGLMKLLAEKRHPRYLIHRKRVFRLFAKRKKRQS